MDSSKRLFDQYAAASKGYQTCQRTKMKILTFANLIDKEPEYWTEIEIFALWRYLEQTSKQYLTHNGLRNMLQDIKVALETMGINLFTKFDREIRLFSNGYLNSRIDQEIKPWSKRNANRPSYANWLKISKAMSAVLRQDDFTNADKKLRMHQAKLALVWTRSGGARLAEIMRMRLSDIKVLTMDDGHRYLNLNIRRSKSNRKGKKMLNYKCLRNKLEPELCPIQAFSNYLSANRFINNEGDFIFPSSESHKENHISGKLMIDNWKKICKMLGLPADQYPMAHSGHDCLLLLAVAQKRPREEILDATQWTSIASLSHYVEGPTANNINKILATTSVKDLDKATEQLREYNTEKV